MQLPPGMSSQRKTDNTLVKALARAFRWRRMLESGEFATIADLAEREDIALSYMTRVLRLTHLAPDTVGGDPGRTARVGGSTSDADVGTSIRLARAGALTRKPECSYPAFPR